MSKTVRPSPPGNGNPEASSSGGDSPFKHWVVRHEVILAVLGAILVICTFVIKDILRDVVKDQATEVEGAMRAYNMGVDSAGIEDSIHALGMDMRAGTKVQRKKDPKNNSKARDTFGLLLQALEESDSAEKRLSLTRELLASLPNDAVAKQTYEEIAKSVDDTSTSITAELPESFDVTDDETNHAKEAPDSDEATKKKLTIYTELLANTDENQARLMSFGEAQLQRAHEVLKKTGRQYAYITAFSLAFVVIGVGLTLLGHLFGLELSASG